MVTRHPKDASSAFGAVRAEIDDRLFDRVLCVPRYDQDGNMQVRCWNGTDWAWR